MSGQYQPDRTQRMCFKCGSLIASWDPEYEVDLCFYCGVRGASSDLMRDTGVRNFRDWRESSEA